MTELIEIQKRLSVPKDRKGGQGNYTYRSVDDILEAVKKVMPEGCYMTMTDTVQNIGGRNYICAEATLHTKTDSISATGVAWEPEKLAAMSMPQITGSCSSYARKSALCGLLMIDDSKDVDSFTALEIGRGSPEKPATKKQIEELQGYCVSLEATGDSRAEWLSGKIESGLTFEEADKIIARLK